MIIRYCFVLLDDSKKEDDDVDQQRQEVHNIQAELKDTFTPELAHLAYIPFCKLAGGSV